MRDRICVVFLSFLVACGAATHVVVQASDPPDASVFVADAASALDASVVDATDASFDASDAATDPHIACGYTTLGVPSFSHPQNNAPDAALPRCRNDLANARAATASDLRVTLGTATPSVRSDGYERLEISIANLSDSPVRIIAAKELLVTAIDAVGKVVIPPAGKPVIIRPSYCDSGDRIGLGPDYFTLAPLGHAETVLWWPTVRVRFQRLEGCDYAPPWPVEEAGPLPPGHYRLKVSIPLEKGSSLPGEVDVDVTKAAQ